MYNYRQAQLYFAEKGIKPSNLGYRYLLTSIQLLSSDPRKYTNVSELYKAISEEFNRNTISIERAIRYSLKPLGLTNKVFISQMANDLIYNNLNNADIV